jgi:hypothetical protein
MSRSILARPLCLLLTFAPSLFESAAAAEATPPKPRVSIPGVSRIDVQQAVERAGKRLAGGSCRALLSEYHREADNLSLAAGLEERGLTLEQHLATLAWVDGSADPACRRGAAFAGMARSGERRVYVCPNRFRELARTNAVAAEVVVVHEVLHTLGLGENPPSSREITARVFSRCVNARDRQWEGR